MFWWIETVSNQHSILKSAQNFSFSFFFITGILEESKQLYWLALVTRRHCLPDCAAVLSSPQIIMQPVITALEQPSSWGKTFRLISPCGQCNGLMRKVGFASPPRYYGMPCVANNDKQAGLSVIWAEPYDNCFEGELRRYSSVTDAFSLRLQPWLRFNDLMGAKRPAPVA